MIAGGIGITPFMAQTAQLAAEGGNFELHYAFRTAALGTYADVLAASATAAASTSTTTTGRDDRRSTACSTASRSARISMSAARRR